MPGDGTGPEVTIEALKVPKTAYDKLNFKYESTEFDFIKLFLDFSWTAMIECWS